MEDKALPAYVAIERDMRKKIEGGHWAVGMKLPQENSLAAEYQTSRQTLRKSLAILSAEGYLYRIPGRGTFITSPDDKDIALVRKRQSCVKRMNRGVAVLVPSVQISLGAGIVRGAEDMCRTQGYHVVLGNYEGQPAKEREYLDMFIQRGLSGLVVFPGHLSDPDLYRRILKDGVLPLVFAGSYIPGVVADVVKTDNFTAAYNGTRLMIKEGCRNILFCGRKLQSAAIRERLAGYREALLGAGLPLRTHLVNEGDPGLPVWTRKVSELLSGADIDGIFSANESTTIGLTGILNDRSDRSKPPRIVAFDQPQYLRQAGDAIDFIRQPAYEIGRVAAELLLARIREGKPVGPEACRKILLPAATQCADTLPEDSLRFADVT